MQMNKDCFTNEDKRKRSTDEKPRLSSCTRYSRRIQTLPKSFLDGFQWWADLFCKREIGQPCQSVHSPLMPDKVSRDCTWLVFTGCMHTIAISNAKFWLNFTCSSTFLLPCSLNTSKSLLSNPFYSVFLFSLVHFYRKDHQQIRMLPFVELKKGRN